MVLDKVETKYRILFLILLICFSCVLLDRTGVAAHNFEESHFFDYANLSYISVVLVGIMAMAAGGLSLVWLSYLAEKELKEK